MIDAIFRLLASLAAWLEKRSPTFAEARKMEIEKQKQKQDKIIDQAVDKK